MAVDASGDGDAGRRRGGDGRGGRLLDAQRGPGAAERRGERMRGRHADAAGGDRASTRSGSSTASPPGPVRRTADAPSTPYWAAVSGAIEATGGRASAVSCSGSERRTMASVE